MKRIFKRSILSLIIGLIILSTGSQIHAQKINTKRIAGKNRIETAIQISKELGLTRDTAIISSTTGEVDALASTLLTKQTGGVQFLTGPDTLASQVGQQLKMLNIKKIYLIGGESILSKSIEDELKKSYDVTRLAGKDRIETSTKIINELSEISDTYFLVNGFDGLADALSIGPVAGRDNSPILQTKRDDIPKATLDIIKRDKPNKITIVGGNSVISKGVENTLKSITNVDRISGTNRMETSIKIAKEFYNDSKGAIFANGYTFADALSGGYYAIDKGEPLILLSNSSDNRNVRDYVRTNGLSLTILGGENAISKTLKNKLVDSANNTEDRVRTKAELESIIINGIENRDELIEIDFYGEGFNTTESIHSIIRPLNRTGSYELGNLDKWSVSNGQREGYRKIKFYPIYRTTNEEEAFINSEVQRILNNLISGKMSEFDKVKVIHDYLVDNITYSNQTTNSPASPYTLFKEGKGTCNAYSLALSKFLDYNGIDNYYVAGDGKSRDSDSWGLHAWNKVKVNNKWYNIDSTWNFSKSKYGLHNAYYNFLVSDNRFYKTHKPLYKDLLPVSTDSRYDGMYDGNFSKK